MKYITEITQRDELFSSVIQELKHFGIKVPKIKKCHSKQDNKADAKLFGVPISSLPSVVTDESGTQIPKFLHDCASVINKNLDTEGLFRLAGSITRQKELRKNLENGEDVEKLNIHVYDLGNLLKQFFRELPDPLITNRLNDHFIKAQSLEDNQNRVYVLLLLCLLLPLEHVFVLRYTMQLLANIALNCECNRMDAYNLAVIMAPNLMHHSEKAEKGIKSIQAQTDIINILIHYSERIGMVPMTILEKFSPLNNNVENESIESLKENKKRRSSINGVFHNLRKRVTNSRTPTQNAQSLQIFTYNTPVLNEQKALLKRKAEEELLGTPAKKQASHNIARNETETIFHPLPSTPCLLTTQEHLEAMHQTNRILFSLDSPSFHFTKKESLDFVSPFKRSTEIQKTPKEKTKHRRFFSPLKLPKRSRKLGMPSPRISFRKQHTEKNPTTKIPLQEENKPNLSEMILQKRCDCENENAKAVIIVDNLPLSSNVTQQINGTNEEAEENNRKKTKVTNEGDEPSETITCCSSEAGLSNSVCIEMWDDGKNVSELGTQPLSDTLTPITAVCNQLDAAKLCTPTENSDSKHEPMKNKIIEISEMSPTEEMKIIKNENGKNFLSKRMGSKSLREKDKSMFIDDTEINASNAILKRTYSEHCCSPRSKYLANSSLRRGRPNTVHSGLPQPSPFKSLEMLNDMKFFIENGNKNEHDAYWKNEKFQGWLKDNDIFLEERKTNSICKLKQEKKLKHAVNQDDSASTNTEPSSFMMSYSSDLNYVSRLSFEDYLNNTSDNKNTVSSWSSLGSVLSSSSFSIKDEISSPIDGSSIEDENNDLGKLQLSEEDELKDDFQQINYNESTTNQIEVKENNINQDEEKHMYQINDEAVFMSSHPLVQDQDDVGNILTSDIENVCKEELNKGKTFSYRKNTVNQNSKRRLNSRLSNTKSFHYGLRNTPKIAPLTNETQSILSNVAATLQKKTESDNADVVWQEADSAINNDSVSATGRPSLIRLKTERAGMVSANVMKYNSITGKDFKIKKNSTNLSTTPINTSKLKDKSTLQSHKKRLMRRESSKRKSTSSPILPMTEYLKRHSFRASKYGNELIPLKTTRHSSSAGERKKMSPKYLNRSLNSRNEEYKFKVSKNSKSSSKTFTNCKLSKSSILSKSNSVNTRSKDVQKFGKKQERKPLKTMTKQISAPI